MITMRQMLLMAGCCLALACAAFGQTPEALTLNRPLERQLKGGETHNYEINLAAGQFARAEVVQSAGFDVVVSLFTPDGKLFVNQNAKNGYLWRESLPVIAETAGAYRLAIAPVEANALPGSYTVTLAELREPTPADRQRLAAEQAFSQARNLSLQDGAPLAEVVKQYEAALNLWRIVGDKYWEAVTLTNLGWINSNSGNDEKAVEWHTQALTIYREIKDKTGIGKATNGLGNAYKNLKQYDKAREYYEQALAIRRELKDRSGEGHALFALAGIYFDTKDYEQARVLYEQLLALKRELKDREGEDGALIFLTVVYNNLGQMEKVLECLERRLAIKQEAVGPAGVGDMLYLIGTHFGRLAQYAKAIDYLEPALKIKRNRFYREFSGRW